MQVKLMKKGCELFFSRVQDVSKKVALKIEDVPIVNEFMDVFPSEISGMSPARVVHFTIDLVHFSKIARPMANFMKKESKFEWSETREEAFKILEERLTSAPILTMPDGYEVYIDASKNGLGCVWQDNEKIDHKRPMGRVQSLEVPGWNEVGFYFSGFCDRFAEHQKRQ
ncbi:uncharacterized protein LOC130591132 [Beta vulgaris subsp. vulgaris]|uniref:uncharacterized protein LOC130591132 n=1 Tax=Beta vulgaris subsp. vulgaris TaxID=3555 RepID=UPI00254884BA|nr:uncharacterized protein LOC130591132 [Beta vulgaris subsp. vulgaris]